MQWPWVSRRLLELTERELTYYRAQYEREKERADRAVDSLVQWCGREPISQPVRAEAETHQSKLDAMQAELNEVFTDVMGSVLGEDITDSEDMGTQKTKI